MDSNENVIILHIKQIDKKSTDELKKVLKEKNLNEWSEKAFVAERVLDLRKQGLLFEPVSSSQTKQQLPQRKSCLDINSINIDQDEILFRRMLAFIIDDLIIESLSRQFVINIIEDLIFSYNLIINPGVVVFIVFIIFLIYKAFMHGTYGKTIGKMITGIKVIDVYKEKNITYKKSVLRYIVHILTLPLYGAIYLSYSILRYDIFYNFIQPIGYFWIFCFIFVIIIKNNLNNNRVFFHDFITGSLVVKS